VLEVLLLLFGVAGAARMLAWLAPGTRTLRGPLLSGALLSGACYWFWKTDAAPEHSAEHPSVRVAAAAEGYAGSGACRSCHPSEYASWHQSYHRSMTELPSEESVRAPWNGSQSDFDGNSYRLFRRNGEFWVALPDPDELAQRVRTGEPSDGVPRVERPVVMTTGSHHYQAYWVPGRRGNEIWQLPLVYHFESQRFLPRPAVFLEPPDDPPVMARWNSSCVQCHSVAGQPRHDLDSDRFDTRVAELGIACEACHGPAQSHVARQRNPLTRYEAHGSGAPDPSIVNPARLSAERASEVCGQCHAYFVPTDPERWWEDGFSSNYTPGDGLDPSRHVLDWSADEPDADALVGGDLQSAFYADGSVRVGGREWNGLRLSACFQRGHGAGQLSCLSCHQLHGGTRDAQLGADALGDAACGHCHSEINAQPSAHSHHPAGSSGALCVNCHMPYTSYALLHGVRSHRIQRPSVAADPARLAPNACNACHQDRSLDWTASWLERWYGAPAPAKGEPARAAPAALEVLRGDAATRVVVAAELGWSAAQEASGHDWQAALLVEALDDPYAAVRFVAYRSLRSLPGFEDYAYDFIAEPAQRRERQARARERAEHQWRESSIRSMVLPHDASGRLAPSALADWLAHRDSRPVRIAE
jgi:hypothetical protein